MQTLKQKKIFECTHMSEKYIFVGKTIIGIAGLHYFGFVHNPFNL